MLLPLERDLTGIQQGSAEGQTSRSMRQLFLRIMSCVREVGSSGSIPELADEDAIMGSQSWGEEMDLCSVLFASIYY